MKCMLCGKENPEDALYCGGCGWPQKKQKSSRGGRIIAFGMAAVVLLAALAVIFFAPAKTDPAAPTSGEDAVTEPAAGTPTEPTATEPTDSEEPEPPAALDRYGEKVAETFVVLYWENDMPTLETLVEYHLFNYLEEELDTGRPLACTAKAGQSAPCDSERIMSLQMSLGVNITEAYAVTVDYETAEKSGSTVVTVGKVDGSWVVISYVPFYDD